MSLGLWFGSVGLELRGGIYVKRGFKSYARAEVSVFGNAGNGSCLRLSKVEDR